jgi:GNAT superfamily N-acetyltransferase
MRIQDIITEAIDPDEIKLDHEVRNFNGVDKLLVTAFKDWKIGWVVFTDRDGVWQADNVYVAPEFRRQGVATLMYQYAKSLGYDIQPSKTQTSDGSQMWQSLSDRES